jgi:hypothetical protein
MRFMLDSQILQMFSYRVLQQNLWELMWDWTPQFADLSVTWPSVSSLVWRFIDLFLFTKKLSFHFALLFMETALNFGMFVNCTVVNEDGGRCFLNLFSPRVPFCFLYYLPPSSRSLTLSYTEQLISVPHAQCGPVTVLCVERCAVRISPLGARFK